MPRKIIQIAVVPENDNYYPRLIALTNDNKIFYKQLEPSGKWEELDAIPQDDYNA